ncbi:MAG TPA: class I SAM-dependent methyltransferase [Candidatus Binatia bacterium]|nr:class I SAM-dependent methyltransferase [Candidatus Binatia bacterium]
MLAAGQPPPGWPAAAARAVAVRVPPEAARQDPSLDARVRAFLDRRRGTWRDMNVPEADGRTLHNLILEHNYTRALEIGTSTGHSTIWIAWALSKTGGRVTTIEIDERRHRAALANFEEAGLSTYIDARLADAHELVPKLQGPFDFVFSDADKEWYTQYLIDVLPKLEVGGCFVAHNVSSRMRGIPEFLEYLQMLPNMKTTIDRSSPAGMSISFKVR